MSIKTLLEQEINDEFETLGKIEIGTKEYATTVDGLTKLVDRAIELQKFEADRNDRISHQEEEMDLKKQQAAEEKKDRRVKNWLTAAGIIIPTGTALWGTVWTWYKEVEDSNTSTAGRNMMNFLLKLKK